MNASCIIQSALQLAVVCALVVACAPTSIALADAGEVVWTGDADAFGSAQGSLFEPWNNAVPGDELDGEAVVRNDSNSEVIVYCEATGVTQGDRAADLAAVMPLKVTDDEGAVLYVGQLDGAAMDSVVSLGTIAPGESRTLYFDSEVPAEVGNELALADTQVGWRFTVEELSDDQDAGILGLLLDKTGRAGSLMLGVAAAAGALVAVVVAFVVYRRKGCESD